MSPISLWSTLTVHLCIVVCSVSPGESAPDNKLLTILGQKLNNRFDKLVLDEMIHTIGHKPSTRLAELLPEVKQHFSGVVQKLHKLEHCYESTVGNVSVNIFKDNLSKIVHHFLNEFQHHFDHKLFTDFESRLHILLSNVFYLAKRVIECCLETNPNKLPTKLGLTPLSIYSHDEFRKHFSPPKEARKHGSKILGKLRHKRSSWTGYYDSNYDDCLKLSKNLNVSVPESGLDWRQKGVLAPIKSQADCGSCYIFAGVAAMEAAFMLTTGQRNISFNEQAFLECNQYEKQICKGGRPEEVWQMSMDKGISLQAKGPKYRGTQTKADQCGQYPVYAKLHDFCYSFNTTDEEMMQVVATYGPATVAINISNPHDFQLLRGPWNEPCGTVPGHEVLLVGWDSERWILKNSWGKDWGVNGYLMLSKNGQNTCGIHTEAGVPFFDGTSQPATIQKSVGTTTPKVETDQSVGTSDNTDRAESTTPALDTEKPEEPSTYDPDPKGTEPNKDELVNENSTPTQGTDGTESNNDDFANEDFSKEDFVNEIVVSEDFVNEDPMPNYETKGLEDFENSKGYEELNKRDSLAKTFSIFSQNLIE